MAPEPAGDRAGRTGALEWRATVAGTIEIRLWILSWGSDVEVLAPAALREDVAATLVRAAGEIRGPRLTIGATPPEVPPVRGRAQ